MKKTISILAAAFFVDTLAAAEFHVAATGHAASPGTAEKPFAVWAQSTDSQPNAEAGKSADAGAIHSVAYSHQDLGYANYPHLLRTENRLENLFRCVRFCEQTAGWPKPSKYRFTQENPEAIPFFLSQCTPAEREQLAKHIKEGRIAIAASFTTILTDRLNPESAARTFYLSNRHIPDLLGTPPGKVAIINDVTGVSWSLPIYCQAAGVPFLFNGHNTCGKMDEMETAPIVKWNGPAGTGEVLAHSCVYNYHAVNQPKKELPGRAAKDGARITPSYIPIWMQGHDFAITSLDMATAAKEWNDKGGKPQVYMSTLEIYLDELARRQTAEKTPALNKTGPCQWIDQPITDAWLFGRSRQTAERLPAAEKFSVFAMSATGAGYPWFEFTTAWHNLLCNYEHTISAACWRCKDAEGWRHYETELVEHRAEGLLAYDTANTTLNNALDRLAAAIPAPVGSVVVFNSLSRPRTDVASCPAGIAALTDAATGETVPVQQWPDGAAIFVAKDIPPLGYKVFTVAAAPVENAVSRTATALETPYYKLTVDPAKGTVSSLFDKELARELVKHDAAHAFAEYLYERHPDAKKGSTWGKPPQAVEIKVEDGPVASIVRIRSVAGGVNWLEQTITLYRHLKRIDFSLRMDKQPSGRTLTDYAVMNFKGKEAVFVAMPFDIPGFKAVYQTGGGGVAEPIRDYFKGVGTAFQAVQHFADLSNGQFGVTVSPIDCALVEFDHPRSDAISRGAGGSESQYEKNMEPPQKPNLYLYLMNNMFSTNVRQDQPGEHLFRWAIRSHAGDWQNGQAAQFGEAVNQPLLTRTVPATKRADYALPATAHSFASTDAANVSVTACKLAENNGDGFIVRVVETNGKATAAAVNLPFLGKDLSVAETDLVEKNLETKPMAVEGASFKIQLPPFGVKTFRVRPAAEKGPAPVAGIAAKSLSDLEIVLNWQAVPGAAFYRVYRGDAPGFIPTAFNLVGIVAEPRYLDRARDHIHGWITNRLNPATTYHYRIQAVSATNARGPLSDAVAAKTLTTEEKSCPPQNVRDLRAILVSPLAPISGINLLWRSNVEPTVAGYEVHRSTTPGFTPTEKTLLAKLPVQESAKGGAGNKYIDHQMYLDTKPELSTTYHYKVRAFTKSGLAGPFSNEASAMSKDKAEEVGVPVKLNKEMLGNDGTIQ